MPLSISKLTKLLEDKNFSVKRYYKLYGTCAFVEMISNTSSTTFMMYIQSKYEFKINDVLVFKYWLNCFSTEFLLSIFKLDKCKEASFAFSPIFFMYKFLDIFTLLLNHLYE